ncbi:hypothetical protein [Pseudactinotalea sp. Z1748]|uniref:hypothetical protein n=1 Tax=Pseudactinotalea sp. Z1748 TaxID=3413027 RepID=UPI003C7C1C58
MTSEDRNDAPALTLLSHSQSNGEDVPWAAYAREVLSHAGMSYGLADSPDALRPGGVVLVTEPVHGEPARALATWVRDGGAMVITGEPGDLANVAGVARAVPAAPGLVTCGQGWAQRPPRPVRALRGHALHPDEHAEVLATFEDGSAAITRSTAGAGMVLTFGVDLWYSICRIQQGYPVRGDGAPSSDGTAPIDDDILKAEDGLALDLEEDRAMPPGEPGLPSDYTHTYPPPSAVPIFDQPHADWWRSLLLQALWQGTAHTGAGLAWLDYWPAGIDAIAHMSHDADGNDPADGRAALEAFAAAGVKVTWHQVYPGGYGQEVLTDITDAGHEQSLHYNAMADSDLAHWGWPQLRAQYAWAQAISGREDIVSNKNHYTRWEGWTEFYTWCERVGIQIDSSRGPSKQGTIGFPFGTAHVSFPLRPAGHDEAFHDVLNLPLHTQDLAWAGHISVRDVILDGAQDQHGVAHFLFHGPHLRKRPLTTQACVEVAEAARERGMPWWTAEEINTWERTRRDVRVHVERVHQGWQVRAHTPSAVPGAALILALPEGVQPDTEDVRVRTVQRHGHQFVELGVDLPVGHSSWLLRS